MVFTLKQLMAIAEIVSADIGIKPELVHFAFCENDYKCTIYTHGFDENGDFYQYEAKYKERKLELTVTGPDGKTWSQYI